MFQIQRRLSHFFSLAMVIETFSLTYKSDQRRI